MYITTFYSFKGGVGRTMALANAALELVARGRRVLVVDFDLEAPGLDTIKALRPRGAAPGIVDFVRQYLRTARSPDVREFVYQVPSGGEAGGELWVMPAGSQRRQYDLQFRQIDWNHLYAKRDGYLLFEDMKAQWRKELELDWVFVDSRTGHTDTGGICTRHLPDAVVVVFFPNMQNLRGLERVVRQIREEETRQANPITLHFLMSNVPDLDDEDEILQRQMQAFRSRLGMSDDPIVVHHYPSLALLNQSLFVRDRPRSRLAGEYRSVVETIVRGNLEDRDGALARIRDVQWQSRGGAWRRTRLLEGNRQHSALLRIREHHGRDPEVLYELGCLYATHRREEQAAELFDRAIKAGSTEAEAFLFRSLHRAGRDDVQGAAEDALAVLNHRAMGNPSENAEAIEAAVGQVEVAELLATPAVQDSPAGDRLQIASELAIRASTRVRRVSAAMLERLEGELAPEAEARRRHSLAILRLSSGRAADAQTLLKANGQGAAVLDLADTFNYAMATWSATGTVNPEHFGRVIELASREADPRGRLGARPRPPSSFLDRDPNFLQCLAVAQWAVGSDEDATARLEQARRSVDNRRDLTLIMSCWRYTEVSRQEFLADLDEIEALIAGDDSIRPRFFPARGDGASEGSPAPVPATAAP